MTRPVLLVLRRRSLPWKRPPPLWQPFPLSFPLLKHIFHLASASHLLRRLRGTTRRWPAACPRASMLPPMTHYWQKQGDPLWQQGARCTGKRGQLVKVNARSCKSMHLLLVWAHERMQKTSWPGEASGFDTDIIISVHQMVWRGGLHESGCRLFGLVLVLFRAQKIDNGLRWFNVAGHVSSRLVSCLASAPLPLCPSQG